MAASTDATGGSRPASGRVRRSAGTRAAILAARERSMSERLELALSWNAVAAELRAGLATVKASAKQRR